MKKTDLRVIILCVILFLAFIMLEVLIPFLHNAVFWYSLIFTVLAFIMAGLSAYAGFIKHPDAKSKFYGFPIVKIGAVYLAAQVAAALIFSAVGKWVPLWIPVTLYAIALCAAAVGLISADAVVEQIQVQDEKLKKNVTLMRGLQSKVSQMKTQCEDPAAAKAVAELSEALQYSDPVSSDAIGEAEADLSAAIDELQSAVVDGDSEVIGKLSRKATALLNERNRLCKLNK